MYWGRGNWRHTKTAEHKEQEGMRVGMKTGLWTMVGAGVVATLLAACADDDESPVAGDDGDSGPVSEPGDEGPMAGTEGEGVSITLMPVESADERALDRTVDILQDRVMALGFDDLDIVVDEGSIVVEAPGVADRNQLVDVVGTTGDLRFRPVLSVLPADTDDAELTRHEDDDPDDVVTLADRSTEPESVYTLGPALATGQIIEAADAALNDSAQWEVQLVLRSGAEGIDQFNDIASICYETLPDCPTGQLAMVVDSQIQSAPTIYAPSFESDQIVITAEFDETSAEDLALILSYDTLPLDLELQEISTLETSD